MSTITDYNLKVEFFKTFFLVKYLLDHQKCVASGVNAGGLYKLDVIRKIHEELTSTNMSIKSLSDQRYGHIKYHDLLFLQTQIIVGGLPMFKNEYAAC